MAIIYSYPTVTPNSNDLVLLTDTSSSKATKTASISSLLDLGSTGIISTKINVSSAELLLMGTGAVGSQKILIDSPGVGKAIQIVGAIYTKYNANTTLYTGAMSFFYVYFDLAGANKGNAGTIDDNSIKAGWNMTWIVEQGLKESWYENTSLAIVPNNSFAGGDGSMDVYVNYRIITL